ncbi:hypothetical protein M426DRAFT_228230 [Hypoxylon sp. CI-4A]|nr:hypothetical protein M426DRAFT_228230 [Hypoxylon sp. CI-4A]
MAPRKSVLITGCSAGGIGPALAEVFHEKGYHVFATARDVSKIPQNLSEADNVTVLALDVLYPDSIAAAVESVKRETGGTLDVLVNNSGRSFSLPALDVSIEEGKKMFDTNFWGAFAMLQAFGPLLIEARGCLVNNCSANAYAPMPCMSVYNSSKAALATASETWRHELAPLGVRTITLITCAVKTNAKKNATRAKPELPESSKYIEIRDFIHSLSDGRLQDGGISARQYATKVVRDVEKGTVGTVWAGTSAALFRLVWWLSPQWVLDRIIQSIVPFSNAMAKAAERKA